MMPSKKPPVLPRIVGTHFTRSHRARSPSSPARILEWVVTLVTAQVGPSPGTRVPWGLNFFSLFPCVSSLLPPKSLNPLNLLSKAHTSSYPQPFTQGTPSSLVTCLLLTGEFSLEPWGWEVRPGTSLVEHLKHLDRASRSSPDSSPFAPKLFLLDSPPPS